MTEFTRSGAGCGRLSVTKEAFVVIVLIELEMFSALKCEANSYVIGSDKEKMSLTGLDSTA